MNRSLFIVAFLASGAAAVATRSPWLVVSCLAFGVAAIAKGSK